MQGDDPKKLSLLFYNLRCNLFHYIPQKYGDYRSWKVVHMFTCKRFLGVPIRTPNTMIYGELARYNFSVNAVS